MAPPRHADEALLEPLEALRDEEAEQMGDTSSELVLELLMPEFSIFTLIKKRIKNVLNILRTSVSDVLGIGITASSLLQNHIINRTKYTRFCI